MEAKLERALAEDIIEKVSAASPWISRMVIALEPDGEIRICVDMRRANEAILRENYPLPTFDSITAKFGKARYFSRLDLTLVYHQLEVDENSRHIIIFITHKELFRYKRLMFGVNPAPPTFPKDFLKCIFVV